MRKLFIALCFLSVSSVAARADKPVNWTGFYFGGHGAYLSSDTAYPGSTAPSQSFDGALLGLQAGYNWQIGNVVLGAEADISFGNIKDALRDGNFLGYSGKIDTMGTVLKPKAPTRAAVQHMLAKVSASGGTVHGAGVRALHQAGVRIPAGAKLAVIVAGDEAGEDGVTLANTFRALEYQVAGLALICAVASGRGNTVRTCAQALGVSFTEVDVDQFDDPYQVPRVLRAILEAPVPTDFPWTVAPRASWVDKVMKTPLLAPDGRPQAQP